MYLLLDLVDELELSQILIPGLRKDPRGEMWLEDDYNATSLSLLPGDRLFPKDRVCMLRGSGILGTHRQSAAGPSSAPLSGVTQAVL